MKENIVIYQDKQGKVELRADVEKDTIWATQEQIAMLFTVDVRTVNEHLQNIFKSDELKKSSTIRNFRIVRIEGNRKVNRLVKSYNLNAIIAVGYRVNSKKATQFRIWATRVLREYLVNGNSLNTRRLSEFPEKLEGLEETLKLLRGDQIPGKLKGKIKLTVTKHLESK